MWPRSALHSDTARGLAPFARWSLTRWDIAGNRHPPTGASPRSSPSGAAWSADATATCGVGAHTAYNRRVPSILPPHHTPRWWRVHARGGDTVRSGHAYGGP